MGLTRKGSGRAGLVLARDRETPPSSADTTQRASDNQLALTFEAGPTVRAGADRPASPPSPSTVTPRHSMAEPPTTTAAGGGGRLKRPPPPVPSAPRSAEEQWSRQALAAQNRKDFNEAERCFRLAMESAETDSKSENGQGGPRSLTLGQWAAFLWRCRKDNSGAEAAFNRAVPDFLQYQAGQKPSGSRAGVGSIVASTRERERERLPPVVLADYASFRNKVKNDRDGAEWLYRRAIAVDPLHAQSLGNYGRFLATIRGDLAGAESLYRQALDSAPDHTQILVNYAQLLKQVDRFDEAEELLRRAVDIEPLNSMALNNYANFLWKVRGDSEAARTVYVQGVSANPQDQLLQRNYAIFLRKKWNNAPSSSTGSMGAGLGSLSGAGAALISSVNRPTRRKRGSGSASDGEERAVVDPMEMLFNISGGNENGAGAGGSRGAERGGQPMSELDIVMEAEDPLDEMGTVDKATQSQIIERMRAVEAERREEYVDQDSSGGPHKD